MDKERYFKEAKKFNAKVFASKEKMRKTWAKKAVKEKIKELVKLHEMTAALHPELRKIIPWRLKK
ncbi:MAG: hypothetical protein HY893_09385 [Deltaproteobacteria bacterium]|nr:hypothetical protein [Deltaproteobacteria bacterium]